MTEIFVCPPEEARHHDPGSTEHERILSGGLTFLEFGTLWAILEGQPWDVNKHMFPEVVSTDDTWIHAFPVACVERLAQVRPTEVRRAATEWAASEELAGAHPSDLEPVVEELSRVARLARERSQGLFVWVSL